MTLNIYIDIRYPFHFISNVVVMCLIRVLFSALTLQFVKHRFLDYHDPTIGES